MAKTLIVKLTDDIDGSDAAETVKFALDGKNYEIDLSKKNAAALRKAMSAYTGKAGATGRATAAGSPRRKPRRAAAKPGARGATRFSKLTQNEKNRFRVWADMPTARRIGDARVKAWIDAGKP